MRRKQIKPRFRKKSCPICGRQVSFAHGGNYYVHQEACEKRTAKVKLLRTQCCNNIPVSQDGRKWVCRTCKKPIEGELLKTIRKELIKE